MWHLGSLVLNILEHKSVGSGIKSTNKLVTSRLAFSNNTPLLQSVIAIDLMLLPLLSVYCT